MSQKNGAFLQYNNWALTNYPLINKSRKARERDRMKRICSLLLTLTLVLGLCACEQKAEATWQEQYDLGIRYLAEENYEEAIIAFMAAIEIDPSNSDGYLKLAEAYIELDDLEQAAQVLRDGWEHCPDNAQEFEDVLRELGYRIDDNGALVSLQELEETAFSAYREILDTLYYGILDQWAKIDYEFPTEMISYMWYFYPVKSLSDAGYALLDLNGDDVPELITGVVSDNDWGSAGGMIYDLYTYNDGEVIHLASSGERDRYYLCEDAVISNEGSSGAADSSSRFYELLPDSTALHLIEMIRYYGVDTPDEPYYYSDKDVYDIGEMDHIALTDAEEVLSKYKGASLTLIQFDQYTPDEEREVPASVSPNATSELFPVDYLGMTTGELADLLGDDFRYRDGWFLGAAKPVYYADNRVPYIFYFRDLEWSGIAGGDEVIIIVQYTVSESSDSCELAPGVPARATYAQLSELNFEGYFYGEGDEWMQDMSETGLYQLQYDISTTIGYYWFDHKDPYTTPAEVVMIFRF